MVFKWLENILVLMYKTTNTQIQSQPSSDKHGENYNNMWLELEESKT